MFILVVSAVWGELLTVPTTYKSHELCVYHGEQILEERMKDFQVGTPIGYTCVLLD
jgi:hypothetical protein